MGWEYLDFQMVVSMMVIEGETNLMVVVSFHARTKPYMKGSLRIICSMEKAISLQMMDVNEMVSGGRISLMEKDRYYVRMDIYSMGVFLEENFMVMEGKSIQMVYSTKGDE